MSIYINILLLDLLRCSKYTFTYVDLLQEYYSRSIIYSRKQMHSHVTVCIFTSVSVHMNEALVGRLVFLLHSNVEPYGSRKKMKNE